MTFAFFSPEIWSAIFAGATFVVIAATALAAMVQLRHLRASNQLNALLAMLRLWHDPQVQQWFDYVREELEDKMKDPAFFADLQTPNVDRRKHPELNVCDYWEQIGSYVKHGLLDEESFLDVAAGPIIRFWEALAPAMSIIRGRLGPIVYENFEYIAVRARLWLKGHPQGDYPKNLPRMAELDALDRADDK